ncbi:MAG: efflux RND transporter permease subunit, partial [Vallitaleaceae bacterium]|nr:efflux RND transporter permease subunit [Vallitaleaceae bacterium]
VQSISSEFHSLLILEFNDGTDINMAMMEVREKLDQIQGSLPDDVADPMIIKFNPNMMPIFSFSLTQEGKDMADVTKFVEKTVKQRLEKLEGVASLSVNGGSSRQIEVVLDREKLDVLGLDAEIISNLLKAQNFNFPIGSIEEEEKSYTLRASSEFSSIEEIQNFILAEIPEISLPDGSVLDPFTTISLQKNLGIQMAENTLDYSELSVEEMAVVSVLSKMDQATMSTITLQDLATISYVEKNSNTYSKINGEDAITLSIQKQGDSNTSTVVSLVRDELDQIQKDFPGTKVTITLDQGKYIDQMVQSVSWNAIAGALLAVLILFIFLKDIRPTIIIGLAIPISVIVAFSAIYFTGITLNIVSMGGLALGIGMLVDNAVVVLENIYRLRKEGKSRKEAAIMGTTQVTGAIVASTLTTVAVFIPVVFVKGFTAQIFQEMALTVTITLVASLLVALTLVPMMSSKLIKKPDTSKHHHMMDASNHFYTKVLGLALKHKIVVGIVTLLAFSISIFGVLQVGTELMPATDEGQISIEVSMPRGSLYQDTVTEVSKLENYL